MISARVGPMDAKTTVFHDPELSSMVGIATFKLPWASVPNGRRLSVTPFTSKQSSTPPASARAGWLNTLLLESLRREGALSGSQHRSAAQCRRRRSQLHQRRWCSPSRCTQCRRTARKSSVLEKRGTVCKEQESPLSLAVSPALSVECA